MRTPRADVRQVLAAAAATTVALGLAASVRPVISPRQDAPFYLDAAHGFLTHGLSYHFPREPAYPLFLAAIERAGLPLGASLGLVQNILFMAGLYFFLRSMWGPSRGRVATWAAAALVTLIPTFLVTVNGAMYTESLSCTLVFLMLGALIRAFTIVVEQETPTSSWVKRHAAWAIVAAASAAPLALIKGSFLYVNMAFGIAGALAAVFLKLPATRRIALAVALLGVTVSSWGSTAIWLASRTPPLASFERGGAIFFWRTEYAARFDFRTQTIPFLVNALSESACRRIWDGGCAAYTFEAENDLGFSECARTGGDEQVLYARGIRRILHQPLRQLIFAAFELVRFTFHHGTTGFAEFRNPILEAVVASPVTKTALKVFNVLLYLLPLGTIFLLHRRGHRCRDVWQAWPRPLRLGAWLCFGYALSYLAVYGFATTLLRMVYQIAPLLVVFDAQIALTAASLLRATGARP